MSIDWHDPESEIRAAVFGSGGGIGRALVAELELRPAIASVIAYARDTGAGSTTRTQYETVDITSDESLASAAAAVDGRLDLVIVASGTLHSDTYRPERRLKELSAEAMLDVYRINTVAPALIAKHFLPLLDRERDTVFAALSARVGSISDNRLGGWTSYRASKAALNMVLKTLSIEHARTRPRSSIIGLHPGTVDTALSRPFSGNVPDGKLFTAAKSANYLLDVIARVSPDDTGSVFAWDGQRIDY